MSARCAATATPSSICSKGCVASGVGERGQHAVAGGEIAVGVDGLQADMRGARREVLSQAALDRVGIAPENHRINEPVVAAVGQFILGEALSQPTIAVVR